MQPEKRATIHDVSKRAGVSITTVSRVINDNYPVHEKTKKRVNEAIEALGYRPNLLARSLIQDRTQTIGILTPSIENLFFSEVIKGIDQVLSGADYRTYLCCTNGEPDKEKALVDSLINRSVDGIVVIDPRTQNVTNGFYEGVAIRVPLVLINGHHEKVRCNYILSDDVSGTIEALQHLYDQGHRHIGLLLGRKSHSYDIKEKAFLEFVTKKGLETQFCPVIRIHSGNDLETVSQAKQQMIDVLSDAVMPITAVLCGNDYMAAGALNAANGLGLLVPKDLAIIGFDNTLIAQITHPVLTTVDHHMVQLGQKAAMRMVAIIGNKDTLDEKTWLRTDLVIGATT